jgi:hypothetical protein
MARIRSIKPEFFDDEELCAFGPWHRLCFAGLWTQADKAGRMEDRPKRLKAKVFPYDDLDFEALLSDLATAGFITRYTVADRRYICIPEESWGEHQRPRKDEHESSFPSVTCAEDTYTSLNSDGSVSTECLGSRKVGSRKVGGVEDAPSGDDAPALAPKTRAGDLADLWNTRTQLPIPRCRELTDRRKRHCASRLKERPMEQWAEVVDRIQASAFCHGNNDRGWKATFDWMIESSETAVKVLEGKYDGKRPVLVKGQTEPQPEYRTADFECNHTPPCTSSRMHDLAIQMGRTA